MKNLIDFFPLPSSVYIVLHERFSTIRLVNEKHNKNKYIQRTDNVMI